MTSSNGNIFRVTGPLCGEFTGPGEFPAQRPVTRSFDVFFDLRLNKRLSKQPPGWWFETLLLSLWRQCNGAEFFWGNIILYFHFLSIEILPHDENFTPCWGKHYQKITFPIFRFVHQNFVFAGCFACVFFLLLSFLFTFLCFFSYWSMWHYFSLGTS